MTREERETLRRLIDQARRKKPEREPTPPHRLEQYRSYYQRHREEISVRRKARREARRAAA